MKKVFLLPLLIFIVLAGFLACEHLGDRGRFTTKAVYTGLDRSVSENTLVSHRDPSIALQFDPAFRYLGGQKFVLYGVADAEQHFFVAVNDDRELTSLYWIQFEEFLPSNSYEYDYGDSPAQLNINDYNFYLDTAAVKSNPKNRKRGSDGSLARKFLQSKGYSIPHEYVYARLVHLPDSSRRKELMIIFIGSQALHGFEPADLEEGGKNAQVWLELEKKHLQKIRETLTLR